MHTAAAIAAATAALGQAFTFADIFKSSFLENATTRFSLVDTALGLGLAFLIGLFIYMVYRRTFSGILYARSFNISLVGLCLITALAIMAVTSNIILSLGMVGALSIVRFRTAIKDPMDIVFLFWSIAAGIVSGAGLYLLAVFGSLAVGLILVLFSRHKGQEDPYVLVATLDRTADEAAFLSAVASGTRKNRLKCKVVRPDAPTELTLEVRVRDGAPLVDALSALPGVRQVTLVSYSGELAA